MLRSKEVSKLVRQKVRHHKLMIPWLAKHLNIFNLNLSNIQTLSILMFQTFKHLDVMVNNSRLMALFSEQLYVLTWFFIIIKAKCKDNTGCAEQNTFKNKTRLKVQQIGPWTYWVEIYPLKCCRHSFFKPHLDKNDGLCHSHAADLASEGVPNRSTWLELLIIPI